MDSNILMQQVQADGTLLGLLPQSKASNISIDTVPGVTGDDAQEALTQIGTTLDNHVKDLNNPHNVTTSQIGAATATGLNSHISNTNNPHQVTASQVGALPTTGGTMNGIINMNTNKITNLEDGSSSRDAITFGQFETEEGLIGISYNPVVAAEVVNYDSYYSPTRRLNVVSQIPIGYSSALPPGKKTIFYLLITTQPNTITVSAAHYDDHVYVNPSYTSISVQILYPNSGLTYDASSHTLTASQPGMWVIAVSF